MKNIAQALLAVQAELGPIEKDEHKHYSYATIGAVLSVIIPILNKHGLVILQPLGNVDGKPAVRTLLIHAETGDYIDDYYRTLFEKMGTRGLIVAAYIAPAITLAGGQYGSGNRDPLKTGKAIERAIQKYNRGG